jgi:cytochrome c biogenesis protein CcdA
MKPRARRRLGGLKAGSREHLGTRRLEGSETWRLGGLRRALLGLLVCGVAWTSATTPLLACPICFQAQEGPVTAGVRAAVMVLVGVTVGVLAGFGVFVARFVARSNTLRPGSERVETVEKRPVPLCR